MIIISQVLLWVVVLLLSVAVLAIARQVGVIHARIAPVGALSISRGPQPGESAPEINASTLAGGEINIGGETDKPRLMFFVSSTCPVCKTLFPTIVDIAKAEGLELVVIGDGDKTELGKMADRFKIPMNLFINNMDVGRIYHVGKLPYAVLVDSSGVISAQGLVNTREHVESLVVAHETKISSIQEYLKQHHTPAVDVD